MKKLFFEIGVDDASNLTQEEKEYLVGYKIKDRCFALKRPEGRYSYPEAEKLCAEWQKEYLLRLQIPDVKSFLDLHEHLDKVNALYESLGQEPLAKGDYWTSSLSGAKKNQIFDLYCSGWYVEKSEVENLLVFILV